MSNTTGSAFGASPELPVTVTPQELGVVLDLAANANAPVGRVLQYGDLFARLVKLANQPAPIGAVNTSITAAPDGASYADKQRGEVLSPSYAERNRLNNPVSP